MKIKLFTKIILSLVLIVVLLFSALYAFCMLQGKSILVNEISDITQKKTTIGNFYVVPPLKLVVKNITIEGVGRAEAVSVSPSILGLLLARITLNDLTIIEPEIYLERKAPPEPPPAPETQGAPAEVALTPPPAQPEPPQAQPLSVSEEEAPVEEAPQEEVQVPLVIKTINIKGGNLIFMDNAVGTSGIKIQVKDIYVHIHNLYLFTAAAITDFNIKGTIPWQEGQTAGTVNIQGWLNLAKKDMQATLNIKDIDGIYLYPYYDKWVDLEKARIEKAKLNFSSNINSLNNDLTAECHLELADIVFRPRTADEQVEKAERIATAVLGIFKSLNQGKIILDFKIKTKMDRPEFGVGDIRSAFETKLVEARRGDGFNAADILKFPAKILEGTVKGATDITKAVIVGTIGAGIEVKKTVEGAFRKEPKEDKQ